MLDNTLSSSAVYNGEWSMADDELEDFIANIPELTARRVPGTVPKVLRHTKAEVAQRVIKAFHVAGLKVVWV